MAQLVCIIVLALLLIGCLFQLSAKGSKLKVLEERLESLKKDADALDLRYEGLKKVLNTEKGFLKDGFLSRVTAQYNKAAERVDNATTPEELHDAQIELDRWAAATRWVHDNFI